TWCEKTPCQANPSSPVVDRVGTVGGDTAAIPEWSANTMLTWSKGGMDVTWTSQYISSLKDRKYANALDAGSSNPRAGITNPTVPSYWYHHLNASYRFGDGSLRVYGGVRNLFDKGAPLLSTPIEGNTDGNTYDVIGRYFHVGFGKHFGPRETGPDPPEVLSLPGGSGPLAGRQSSSRVTLVSTIAVLVRITPSRDTISSRMRSMRWKLPASMCSSTITSYWPVRVWMALTSSIFSMADLILDQCLGSRTMNTNARMNRSANSDLSFTVYFSIATASSRSSIDCTVGRDTSSSLASADTVLRESRLRIA